MSLILSTPTSCHPSSCSGFGFCSSVGEKQLSLATCELENAMALRRSSDSMDMHGQKAAPSLAMKAAMQFFGIKAGTFQTAQDTNDNGKDTTHLSLGNVSCKVFLASSGKIV